MFTTNTEKIIKAIKSSENGMALSQIQKELKLNKSSIFYELQKLEEEGILLKENVSPKKVIYKLANDLDLRNYIKRQKAELEKLLTHNEEKVLSDRPKLVFVDDYKLPEEFLEKLSKKYEIITYSDPSPYISEDLFLFRAKDAEVLVTFYSITIGRELLLKLPKLKVIVTPTLTKSYIDQKTCDEMGIEIRTLPWENNYKRSARREFVFAGLFALLRPVHVAHEHLRAGFFDYRSFNSQEIKGKKIGIVGATNFGKDMIPIFKAFGADVYVANPDKENIDKYELGVSKFYSIDALFKICDVMVFPEDYKSTIDITSFVSESMSMKYLMVLTHKVSFNIEKLRDFIIKGIIKGIHIDYFPDLFKVFEDFPNSEYRKIMNFPNVIVSPEIAFYTEESMNINKLQTFEILMNL